MKYYDDNIQMMTNANENDYFYIILHLFLCYQIIILFCRQIVNKLVIYFEYN